MCIASVGVHRSISNAAFGRGQVVSTAKSSAMIGQRGFCTLVLLLLSASLACWEPQKKGIGLNSNSTRMVLSYMLLFPSCSILAAHHPLICVVFIGPILIYAGE